MVGLDLLLHLTGAKEVLDNIEFELVDLLVRSASVDGAARDALANGSSLNFKGVRHALLQLSKEFVSLMELEFELLGSDIWVLLSIVGKAETLDGDSLSFH